MAPPSPPLINRHRVVVPNYSHGEKRPTPVSPEGVIEALTGHAACAMETAANRLLGRFVLRNGKMQGPLAIFRPRSMGFAREHLQFHDPRVMGR